MQPLPSVNQEISPSVGQQGNPNSGQGNGKVKPKLALLDMELTVDDTLATPLLKAPDNTNIQYTLAEGKE